MAKETPEEFIKNRLAHMNTKRAYAFALTHPEYPLNQQEKNKKLITILCNEIEEILPEIEGLIRKIFTNISSITEQTKTAAAYLLIGRAYSYLQSSLILCRAGKNMEAMELSRSGKESLDLAMLFWDDKNKNQLDKWFKGKIISNFEARDFQHELLNKELADKFENKEQPIKDMLSESYGVMSGYTHSAYAGLLDGVDVFKLDFDFTQNAGYHYCINNFHIVEDLLIKILLQLKNSFLNLKDRENFIEADKLFKLFESKLTDEELKETMSKYKKNNEKID